MRTNLGHGDLEFRRSVFWLVWGIKPELRTATERRISSQQQTEDFSFFWMFGGVWHQTEEIPFGITAVRSSG